MPSRVTDTNIGVITPGGHKTLPNDLGGKSDDFAARYCFGPM